MENKISTIIGTICMPLGAGIMLFSLLSQFSLFFFLSGGLLIVLPLMILKNRFKRPVDFEKKTYEWYKDTYPSNVQGDVITCSTCEVNSLDVRPLKNEMFQREIYCTECGKTLYYFSL